MAKPGVNILQGICFKAQGDVGPMTSYTNKRGIVMFLKAWLRDPASPAQIAHRDRIRQVARNWKAESQTVRTAYEQCTKTLSMYINGYNLYMCVSMNPDGRSSLPTLERQSGQTLPLPPPE